MMQKHNRHLSFSLYISVLAITDTIALIIGKRLFSLSENKYPYQDTIYLHLLIFQRKMERIV